MSRREFLATSSAAVVAATIFPVDGRAGQAQQAPDMQKLPRSSGRPNLLLITADDMNWDAVGAFGCPVPGTTPNLDALAAQGMRFDFAHVNAAVCQPSRSVLLTGRFPHRCGGEGFFNLRLPGIPILPAILRESGYRVGILGKTGHSTPYSEFRWDLNLDLKSLGQGRNPAIYGQHALSFMEESRRAGTPFFLMLNSHDPHRPFYGNDNAEWYKTGGDKPPAVPPSRVFSPDEIVVPPFLEDLPGVRQEIAEYYSSVRRCDDTVGRALAALDKSGCADDTLVIFLSDNGMAFPFAKTNCYLQSTRTPWIVRWPKSVQPGQTDRRHFISGIDLTPTILEAAGIPQPAGMDGASFLPLLQGQTQSGREHVFTQFHLTAEKRVFPMRGVQNRRFGYIYNPWSNGSRQFKNESMWGRTFEAMEAACAQSPEISARVSHFLFRVPEELYDFVDDPGARHNLIDSPAHAGELAALRRELETWMDATGDPALESFRQRHMPEAREKFVESQAVEFGGIS